MKQSGWCILAVYACCLGAVILTCIGCDAFGAREECSGMPTRAV